MSALNAVEAARLARGLQEGAGDVDLRGRRVVVVLEVRAAEARGAAEVGDDVFGDDPTVNALQERIAALLGKEAALFVPSGTQSNLVAIMSHCGRGDEYIVGQQQHCYRWEGGGAAVFGSVQPQPLAHAADGSLPLADIEAAIKPDDAHFARSKLLALENTLGGKLIPLDYVQQATALAQRHGLARHLDGARLFNAAVAQAAQTGGDARAEAKRIAQNFDSVSVCFSKGLGAPVGSALCGSRDLIARAHRIRKMAGGGMRQAGLLAAAALYALDNHVERLAKDRDDRFQSATEVREHLELLEQLGEHVRLHHELGVIGRVAVGHRDLQLPRVRALVGDDLEQGEQLAAGERVDLRVTGHPPPGLADVPQARERSLPAPGHPT